MKKVSDKEVFEFSTAFALVFIILYLLKGIVLFLYVAIFLLFASLFFRKVNTFLFSLLTNVGSKIGSVLSKVFLTLAYFIVLVPTAFIYKKLTNVEETPFFKNKYRKSYFIERKKQIASEDFEKMW